MSNFKSSFVSTMSDERRKEIAKQVIAAMRAGDEELATKLTMQVPLSLPKARVLWSLQANSLFRFLCRCREQGFSKLTGVLKGSRDPVTT